MSTSRWGWFILYVCVLIVQNVYATKKTNSPPFGKDATVGARPLVGGRRAFGANSICAYCRYIGHSYCISIYCAGSGGFVGPYNPYGGLHPYAVPFYQRHTLCLTCQMLRDENCIRRMCTIPGFGQQVSGGVFIPPPLPRPDPICAYCQRMNNPQCIQQYCSGAQPFTGGSGSSVLPYTGGGMSVFPPIQRRGPICSYCIRMNDYRCIRLYCRRFVDGTIGNGEIAGFPPITRDPVCASCMQINDQHCIRKYCRGFSLGVNGAGNSGQLGSFGIIPSGQGSTFGSLNNAISQYVAVQSQQFRNNPNCAQCRLTMDPHCIRKYCIGLSNVSPVGGALQTTGPKKKRKFSY